MKLLRESRPGFPAWPIDIESKQGQVTCRDVVHCSIEELHEALRELKNVKKHRATEIKEFDRAKFVEELTDVAHYFYELLILVGVTPDEFFNAYIAKGSINEKRILGGY